MRFFYIEIKRRLIVFLIVILLKVDWRKLEVKQLKEKRVKWAENKLLSNKWQLQLLTSTGQGSLCVYIYMCAVHPSSSLVSTRQVTGKSSLPSVEGEKHKFLFKSKSRFNSMDFLQPPIQKLHAQIYCMYTVLLETYSTSIPLVFYFVAGFTSTHEIKYSYQLLFFSYRNILNVQTFTRIWL